ncbi:MAG TPA: alkyl hydroperoxide reductase [Thermoanaerobaculia bacterium]|nr:alkyl hydroperoxide reductase [Thermoanaerobaculia bacterium]
MRRVAERFPDELVVIGVHSPKFEAEKETPALAAAVARHGIEHPVVNDRDFAIWQAYGARAWPTVVLVDPQGYVLAQQAGEIDADELSKQLESWIAEYRERGALTAEPLPFSSVPMAARSGLLAFPAKVALAAGFRASATASNGAGSSSSPLVAWVADTDHHRVLELELEPGAPRARLRRSFGSGEAGFGDGPAERAAFRRPHGLTSNGATLYVADTDNHAVRGIDLQSGAVRTLAGTGEMARHFVAPQGDPRRIPLRSPWDVLAAEDIVFVAMAGSHQIWVLMEERELLILAGTGREALVDGHVAEASFNQPSGLALAGSILFVADAEASAIRAISIEGDARVQTIVGRGLFDFGDVDGTGDEVRLQHPTGIAWAAPYLYAVDTYNDKVKRVDPGKREVVRIASGFAQPEGIAAGDGFLLVADTNAHRLGRVDLATGQVDTLEIDGG